MFSFCLCWKIDGGVPAQSAEHRYDALTRLQGILFFALIRMNLLNVFPPSTSFSPTPFFLLFSPCPFSFFLFVSFGFRFTKGNFAPEDVANTELLKRFTAVANTPERVGLVAEARWPVAGGSRYLRPAYGFFFFVASSTAAGSVLWQHRTP